MSIFDKISDIMNLDDEEEFDEDDYTDYSEEEEEKKAPKRNFFKRKEKDYDYDLDEDVAEESKKAAKSSPKVTPITKRRSGSNGMEVCVIKPTNFEDSKEITLTLRSGRAVVLNFEGLDMDLAQRIIDFSAGVCDAIDGNLRKVSSYIFIVTPNSVDISGDYQEVLSEAYDVPGVKTDF